MILDANIIKKIRKITINDIKKGSKAYIQNESRGYFYPNSFNKVQNNFGKLAIMSDGITDLLYAWHNNFYRFGPFDKKKIERCIGKNMSQLRNVRKMNIRRVNVKITKEYVVQIDANIERKIEALFRAFLDATASSNSRFTRKTITGTSKALSLLAPNLFPMVDEKISQAYDCWWVYSDFGFIEYSKFMIYMKILYDQLLYEYSKKYHIKDLGRAEKLLTNEIKNYSGDLSKYNKNLLKMIDEYNYAKYTTGWISTTSITNRASSCSSQLGTSSR